MTTSIRVLCLLLMSCAALRASMTPPVTCSGGAELIAGGCYCANGMTWNGQTCQGTPDPTGCTGGGFLFGPPNGQSCHCMLGTTLDSSNQCVALQCTGGAVPGDSQCVCPTNSQWDGSQCVTPQLACNGGAIPSGDQCVCPDGTTWDGNQCSAAAPTPEPVPEPAPVSVTHRTCISVMGEKNYAPALWENCRGVNERCAIAVLDHNYAPALLENCRGVDGACAEQLLNENYSPALLTNCRRHR